MKESLRSTYDIFFCIIRLLKKNIQLLKDTHVLKNYNSTLYVWLGQVIAKKLYIHSNKYPYMYFLVDMNYTHVPAVEFSV